MVNSIDRSVRIVREGIQRVSRHHQHNDSTIENSKSSWLPEEAFSRADESDDRYFYAIERPGPHLDVRALQTVERVIGELVVEDAPVILDLMAGIDSHIPQKRTPATVVGLGMNVAELEKNAALSGRVVHDLNVDPRLPFDDEMFDVVLNTVSVDYLTQPFAVFAEIARILKPGGLLLVFFSNRYFPEKVVKAWREGSEEEHVLLVEEFFRNACAFERTLVFVSKGFPRPSDDKYADFGIPSDPIYAVYAERAGRPADRKKRPIVEVELALLTDEAALKAKKRKVKETLCCPYCDGQLSKWEVPQHPFTEWDTDFMFICFNDYCPYYMRGWNSLAGQGTHGVSYRFLYNPQNGATMPIPVPSPHALKDGIVEE